MAEVRHPLAGTGAWSDLMRSLPSMPPDDLGHVLEALTAACPWATSAAVHLTDYPDRLLLAIDPSAGGPLTHDIDGTLAGRAFRLQQVQAEPAPETPDRLWVPLTNRWRRLGVLELGCAGITLDAAQDQAVAWASLVATLIDSASRCTDAFVRSKRREGASLTAEMQWELLPPLCVAGGGVTLAGRLEPAYEVGGDAFDYALNDRYAHAAIFDPLGHDLRSSLLAALAVGTYRHGRRSDMTLAQLGPAIDAVVSDQYPDGVFVTGQLVVLDRDTGLLSMVNAGHPLPVLVRGTGALTLDLPVDPPWGLDHRRSTVTEVALEPGDVVLLYTDGLVEARSPAGQHFGLHRLQDLIGREAHGDHAAPELLRRLLEAVIAHRGADLEDDATALLLEWRGPGEASQLGG